MGKSRRNAESGSEDDGGSERDELQSMGGQSSMSVKRKKSKGGFHAMLLSEETLQGIKFLGFKQPTPIQRKAIPPALQGRDVVAMARTGSGKTAAFLIPIIERLKSHVPTTRSIILSPTRELAQQTYKVARNLGKRTDLRFCLLQGGDSLESQFEALAANPDVLIATPGRLAHLLLEATDFDLNKVEMLVMDEADRLFELGFQVQLQEIISRTPESRQTLLFSATMPKQVADFTRARLKEPEIVRLDTETRVSDTLKLAFFRVRTEERAAALLHILRDKINNAEQSTIIFCGTKHQVEFIGALIRAANIVPFEVPKTSKNDSGRKGKKPAGKAFKTKRKGSENDEYDDDPLELRGVGVAHGSMDQAARTASLERFRSGQVKVFVVTDLAARGLDIPHVNNVINYDFPDKAKLFIHRVGRAARQGRSGTAFSLCSTDELGHLVDVMLYLGRSLDDKGEDQIVGTIPQSILDPEYELVHQILDSDASMGVLQKGAINAHKMYVKTRADASKRSHKRAKEIEWTLHPIYTDIEQQDGDIVDEDGSMRKVLTLRDLATFRPKKTTFEVEHSKGGTNVQAQQKTAEFLRLVRSKDDWKVLAKGQKKKGSDEEEESDGLHSDDEEQSEPPVSAERKTSISQESDTQESGETRTKRRISAAERKRAKRENRPLDANMLSSDEQPEKRQRVIATPAPGAPSGAFRDSKFYLSHESSSGGRNEMDDAYESQLRINRIEDAVLDLGDDSDLSKNRRTYLWDKKKKRYIQATQKDHADAKRLKKGAEMLDVRNPGEAYEKWARKTRKRIGGGVDAGEETDVRKVSRIRKELKEERRAATRANGGRPLRDEVKNEEQIVKARKQKSRLVERMSRKNDKSKGKQRPKAGSDAKALRIGKHKPKPGKFSRSKAIAKGGGGKGRGGKRR